MDSLKTVCLWPF